MSSSNSCMKSCLYDDDPRMPKSCAKIDCHLDSDNPCDQAKHLGRELCKLHYFVDGLSSMGFYIMTMGITLCVVCVKTNGSQVFWCVALSFLVCGVTCTIVTGLILNTLCVRNGFVNHQLKLCGVVLVFGGLAMICFAIGISIAQAWAPEEDIFAVLICTSLLSIIFLRMGVMILFFNSKYKGLALPLDSKHLPIGHTSCTTSTATTVYITETEDYQERLLI